MLTPRQRSLLKNKIAGAVYGFAIGDAMGCTTEFMSKEQVKSFFPEGVTEIVGGGAYDWKRGEVTDDTQMSLCVMRALMALNEEFYFTKESEHDDFKYLCADEFILWYLSGPKDIGNQCRKAIYYFYKNQGWLPDDVNALGNGSLMRAMPCALIGEHSLNVIQSDLTHPNDHVRGIVQKYSEVLWSLIFDYMGNNTISDILGPQMSSECLSPSGHIDNTFNNALWWADKEDFDSCVIGAVNDGGDADTIAAIAGSLAGARFGLKCIPSIHIAALDKKLLPQFGKFIDFALMLAEVKLCQ